MRIKKLEISGFKSFAERTVLSFGPGITGVVGPNGCGKSNIVDSIRWCMGEMSAKHLRGRAMQDVIFAGADNRGPSGMAEVTLTMLNDGDALPQYGNVSEIALTRRLHRDGTSEYLINKAPARLKDITDLFLGTGVGTRAYSIIEQGRIGFIVNSRPEDRRTLIEEVAGITKFKTRKKAAERRMQATEQNLLRVNDIVAELERQLVSLRRQAKKAERYKRLKADLRELDLHAASAGFLRLAVLEKVQRQERQKLESRIADESRFLGSDETRLETERLRLLEEEEKLRQQQARTAEIDAKLAGLERDLEHWRTQRDESKDRYYAAKAELAEVNHRESDASAERGRLQEAMVVLQSAAASGEDALSQEESEVEALTAELARLDRDLEFKRNETLERVHRVAQYRTQLSGLEKQRTELEGRTQRARDERLEIAERVAYARTDTEVIEERLKSLASELEQWREQRLDSKQRLQEITKELTASDARVLALRSELAEQRSRLQSLEEIARRFEGYSDGVRTLMEAHPEQRAGLHGVLTDFLEVEPAFERAIESVLAERVQYFVAESMEVGVRAIDFLKACSGGRSGFIPQGTQAVSETGLPTSDPGLLGRALDFVKVRGGYDAVAEALLGNVHIVDNSAAAQRIWHTNGYRGRLVTRDGEVLDRAGILSGGSSEGAGLLAKRREIRELAAQVQHLTQELGEAQRRHAELEGRRLQIDVDVQQLDKDIHTAELEHVEGTKDLEAKRDEVKRLVERDEVLQIEAEQNASSEASLRNDIQHCQQEAERAELEQLLLRETMQKLQSARVQTGERVGERQEKLTALRVQVASSQEKREATASALERLELSEEDYLQRRARAQSAIENFDALVGELTEKIVKSDQEVEVLAERAQGLHEQLREARAAYENDRLHADGLMQSIKERRHSNNVLQQALVELKMELQRLELERQRLLEQVAERHDIDLLGVVGDYHLRPPPGPADDKRRADLERQLRNLGAINLTAIEECEQVETRCAFLVGQRDDLARALESLRSAIRRINRASRERFQEAFHAVNEMFTRLYPRLFRGGEARLELIVDDDVLEAGVEIVAQPPGKKLQSVGLLSGGEKALTATALVFAIFLIKPSPFCILDEVDAPLDDANVGRFNELLQEMAKLSQFIVITHNKATMSESDRLYGITMEEPGMSKVVAVNLGAEEKAA